MKNVYSHLKWYRQLGNMLDMFMRCRHILDTSSYSYTSRMVRWWYNDQPVHNIVKIRGKIEEKIYTHYRNVGEGVDTQYIYCPTWEQMGVWGGGMIISLYTIIVSIRQKIERKPIKMHAHSRNKGEGRDTYQMYSPACIQQEWWGGSDDLPVYNIVRMKEKIEENLEKFILTVKIVARVETHYIYVFLLVEKYRCEVAVQWSTYMQ